MCVPTFGVNFAESSVQYTCDTAFMELKNNTFYNVSLKFSENTPDKQSIVVNKFVHL